MLVMSAAAAAAIAAVTALAAGHAAVPPLSGWSCWLPVAGGRRRERADCGYAVASTSCEVASASCAAAAAMSL